MRKEEAYPFVLHLPYIQSSFCKGFPPVFQQLLYLPLHSPKASPSCTCPLPSPCSGNATNIFRTISHRHHGEPRQSQHGHTKETRRSLLSSGEEGD